VMSRADEWVKGTRRCIGAEPARLWRLALSWLQTGCQCLAWVGLSPLLARGRARSIAGSPCAGHARVLMIVPRCWPMLMQGNQSDCLWDLGKTVVR
jgi:hypothetical protein